MTRFTRNPDLTSLIGGIVLVALGVLLTLASEDVIDLSLNYLWPALLAAAGAILLASGLRRRRD
jgi:drug/metabolite transporter (DMT)-like permease